MNEAQTWCRRAGLIVGLVLLSGCSLAQRFDAATRIDYEAAPVARKLEVPPALVTPAAAAGAGLGKPSAASTTYSVFAEERAQAESKTTDAASASPIVLPPLAGVRIERSGAQRWLVVDQAPQRVWPLVREFWTQSGFTFDTEAPALGLLETEWRERRPNVDGGTVRATLARWLGSVYATAERDQFRIRLESSGTGTEVSLAHRSMVETLTGPLKDTVLWVARPADPDFEAVFLYKLAGRLGSASAVAPAASVRAAAQLPAAPVPVIEVPERATVQTQDGERVLVLQEAPERAWRALSLALDRLGFTLSDRDRSRGTVDIRYVDPDQSLAAKGLVQKVFGTGLKKDLQGKPYRIVLAPRAAPTGSTIFVRDADGQVLQDEPGRRVTEQIVNLLHGQLR